MRVSETDTFSTLELWVENGERKKPSSSADERVWHHEQNLNSFGPLWPNSFGKISKRELVMSDVVTVKKLISILAKNKLIDINSVYKTKFRVSFMLTSITYVIILTNMVKAFYR